MSEDDRHTPDSVDLHWTEDEIALKGSRQGGVNKTQIHVKITPNACAGPIPRAFAADSPALAVDSRGEHTKMPDYRAYILGREGHRFLRVTEFLRDHADDATALFAAKKLVDGHDVELWDGGRLVARLDGNPSDDFSRLTETPKLAKIDDKE